MKFHLFLTIFATLALLSQHSTLAQDTVENEEEEYGDTGNSLSHEDDESVLESLEREEDKEDLICGRGKICTCTPSNPTVVNCTHAILKSNRLLDTAFLTIKDETFKAQVVYLAHNDIDVLRRNQIMPNQEANILVLDLSYNRIEDVEVRALDRFKKLAKLKLTHNRLRYEEISVDWLTNNLANLHQLHLDFNYIKQLDDGIFDNLVNLTKLVLDGNRGLKLTKDTWGKGLKKLKTLSLDMCDFEELDADLFAPLTSLTELSLSGNKFASVPSALFSAPKLSILAMSGSTMNEIGSFAFKGLKELTKVYMRNMPLLYSVNDCAFCQMDNLEILDLSGSRKLYNINKNAFGGVSDTEDVVGSLQSLQLANCNISTLDESMVEWTDLKNMSIGGNPFNCDCQMKWLVMDKKIYGKNLKSLKQPECSSPKALEGLTFKKAESTFKESCGGLKVDGTTGTDKTTILLMLLGLCGSVFIVGFVYARRRNIMASASFLNRRAEAGGPALGYANLPTRVNGGGRDENEDGDENRLEDDFNRPEFV